jgi:uncharacterized lipoprotein
MSQIILRRALTIAAVSLALATSGCGFMRADRTGYQSSRETRPLEVPPDLDSPPTGSELTIPGSGTAAAARPATATPPPSAAPQSDGATARPAYVGTETSLLLSDESSSAWKRVALALERAGVMTVVGRDESAGTVTLKQDTVKKEGGFIKRMFGRDGTKTDSVTRVVRISAEGAGSRVEVQDESGRRIEDESAREIIAAIKQRLG